MFVNWQRKVKKKRLVCTLVLAKYPHAWLSASGWLPSTRHNSSTCSELTVGRVLDTYARASSSVQGDIGITGATFHVGLRDVMMMSPLSEPSLSGSPAVNVAMNLKYDDMTCSFFFTFHSFKDLFNNAQSLIGIKKVSFNSGELAS